MNTGSWKFLVLFAIFIASCGLSKQSGQGSTPIASQAPGTGSDKTPGGGQSGPVQGNAVLLYDGAGASASDVAAIEALLSTMGLSYSTADENQMNAMTESTLKTFKLILWPGGNSIDMGNALTTSASQSVHQAVLNDGVPYLGLCAGAFIGGFSIYNGFNLTGGVAFDFYAAEKAGILAEMVEISKPGAASEDLVWWDGPQLSGFGDVIGLYPDGTPAIVEKSVGAGGFVILSGVHPEAPADWRTGLGNDTDGIPPDLALAQSLIEAALTKNPLTHF